MLVSQQQKALLTPELQANAKHVYRLFCSQASHTYERGCLRLNAGKDTCQPVLHCIHIILWSLQLPSFSFWLLYCPIIDGTNVLLDLTASSEIGLSFVLDAWNFYQSKARRAKLCDSVSKPSICGDI